jgi:CTP:molybdopterin cytidylyltransferase MocA
MGGENKLLLPYRGSTVVGKVVQTLLGCGLDVVVVLGRDAERVANAVVPARTVLNTNFESGLGSSIAVGAAHVPIGSHILIALGDMPDLRPEVVLSLVAEVRPGTIVVPRYERTPNEPGHPVVFGSDYREKLAGLTGDSGARSVIAANRASVVTLVFEGSLPDIDTHDDLGSGVTDAK